MCAIVEVPFVIGFSSFFAFVRNNNNTFIKFRQTVQGRSKRVLLSRNTTVLQYILSYTATIIFLVISPALQANLVVATVSNQQRDQPCHFQTSHSYSNTNNDQQPTLSTDHYQVLCVGEWEEETRTRGERSTVASTTAARTTCIVCTCLGSRAAKITHTVASGSEYAGPSSGRTKRADCCTWLRRDSSTKMQPSFPVLAQTSPRTCEVEAKETHPDYNHSLVPKNARDHDPYSSIILITPSSTCHVIVVRSHRAGLHIQYQVESIESIKGSTTAPMSQCVDR